MERPGVGVYLQGAGPGTADGYTAVAALEVGGRSGDAEIDVNILPSNGDSVADGGDGFPHRRHQVAVGIRRGRVPWRRGRRRGAGRVLQEQADGVEHRPLRDDLADFV